MYDLMYLSLVCMYLYICMYVPIYVYVYYFQYVCVCFYVCMQKERICVTSLSRGDESSFLTVCACIMDAGYNPTQLPFVIDVPIPNLS